MSHVMKLCVGCVAALMAMASSAFGQSMRITEWMYDGSSVAGGEFIEFTNLSDKPIDMTGWSMDDDHRVPGAFDLSTFGIVQPGESVIVTEDPAEAFRADWGLSPKVKIIGGLGDVTGNNLGRNDEINLYDADDQLVDRLTYGDQAFPGTIRTRWFSGNPTSISAVGANDPYQWALASPGDMHNSWTSANGDVGNPGEFAFDGPPPVELPLYVNEVVASNSTGLMDEDGDFEDWIEIYNAGKEAIDLEGFGLSDNYNNPFKWVFPSVMIAPGEFLVVFASNKDRTDPLGELHTNFAISASGEEIILTHPTGARLDELEPTPIPTDMSYGRQPDGTGEWMYFTEPTPGAANTTEGYDGIGSPVMFSHNAGFYTDGFELELSTDDPKAVIYYTLNGDTPSPGGPTTHVYSGPISIDSREGNPNEHSMIPTNHHTNAFAWEPPTGEVFKITPVRAVASRPGTLSAAVQTRSYLVDKDIHNRYSFPVIVLNTDHDHFFGHENGIYVPGASYVPGNNNTGNYFREGIEWERPVHVEFFEEDRSLAFAQNAGVRIHGGATRRMPQKALRLYARGSYGSDTFEHQIFPDQPDTSYRRILLRSAGQDFNRTFFRDGLLQNLFAEMGLDTQAFRPAVVFLNGEYWGIHNIRERHDRHYLARTHDVDGDALDFLENRWVVRDGNNLNFVSMLQLLSSSPYALPRTDELDMIHDENYEHIQTWMDVEEFITYHAAQYFIRNTDWPQNNIRYWRSYEEGSRWQWVVVDLDLGFGAVGGAGNDVFRRLANANQISNSQGGYHNWSTIIFRSLMRNEQFRRDFLNRFADLTNTFFLPERVIERVDALQAHFEPAMPEHIDRWNKIASMGYWYEEIQRLRNFAIERPDWSHRRVRNHFRGDYGGLPGEMFYVNPQFEYRTLTFENPTPERGHIQVNTVNLADEGGYPWSGVYWRTIALPITAHPSPGYQFDGFVGYPESAGTETWWFVVGGHQTLTAQFSPVLRPGDLNGDGFVDVSDLLLLFAAWGQCPDAQPCPADLNGDGFVDVSDLLILLANWG